MSSAPNGGGFPDAPSGRPSASNQRSNWALAALMALLVLFTTMTYIRAVPLGQPPDEWAQLSYVADVVAGGPPIPDYANSPILFNRQQNYLGHPPLFYSATGMVGRMLGWDPVRSYRHYRWLDALMVAAGIFFWVLIATRLGFKDKQIALLALSTLAVPMFPYLAGSINNDNLVYLGVSVFFYGFVRLTDDSPRMAYVAALGLLIVCLTKATGAVFLLMFITVWVCLERRAASAMFRSGHMRIAAITLIMLGSAYYIPTLIVYHTPFPHPGTLDFHHSPPSHPMGMLPYFGPFLSQMTTNLPFVILTVRSFFPVPIRLFPLFYLMLAMPLLAWLAYGPFAASSKLRSHSDAFMIALCITATIHCWVSWQGYLHTGLFSGMQPRYYSYALPGLFMFAFQGNAGSRLGRVLFWIFALLVLFFTAYIPPRAASELVNERRSEIVSKLQMPTHANETIASMMRAPVSDAGYLDRVVTSNGTANLSGWAIDMAGRHPPRALWFIVRGQMIGTAQPTRERPDVVDALGSHNALFSGFAVELSRAPPDLSPCDVEVLAEQDNGALARLKNSGCATDTKTP